MRQTMRRTDVGSQQVVPDQAPEGCQRRQAWRAVHQADPRDHHRCPAGWSRPGRELPAADGGRQGARQLHAVGEREARDRARQRLGGGRRAVRGDHLRGPGPGQRGGDRGHHDRQQEPDRGRDPGHLHPGRRLVRPGELAVRAPWPADRPAQGQRPGRGLAGRHRRRCAGRGDARGRGHPGRDRSGRPRAGSHRA